MEAQNIFGKREYRKREPGEKLRIAFMYQVASYWPTIESFYYACLADPDVDVRIFYIDDMSVEQAQVKDSGRFLEERRIPYSTYSENGLKEYKPHAALYQPPYDVAYRNPSALSLHLMNMGVRIVYIPYGIEIADTEDARYNHFLTYVIKNSWRIYTFSEIMQKDYFRYCPNRHAVKALGVPKFDGAFHKKLLSNEFILKKAEGGRIILWKMHFPKLIYEGMERRQVTPDLSEYVKFAKHIEEYKELFFVVMPHPMFFSQTIDQGLFNCAQRLFEELETKNNVYFEKGADYRPALYGADGIIIDRSALMVEAGLCGVPVLYMKNKSYEEPLTQAVRPLVDSYEQGTDAEDMLRFVEKFREDGFKEAAERIADTKKKVVPFADGKCGERILEDIKNGVSETENRTIGIVFFGAGFICRHYIERLKIMDNPAFSVIGLSDNDPAKWGTVQAGIQVLPPEQLQMVEFDILVITSEQYYMPIKKKLVYELFLEEEKIVRLDVFAENYEKKYKKDFKEQEPAGDS